VAQYIWGREGSDCSNAAPHIGTNEVSRIAKRPITQNTIRCWPFGDCSQLHTVWNKVGSIVTVRNNGGAEGSMSCLGVYAFSNSPTFEDCRLAVFRKSAGVGSWLQQATETQLCATWLHRLVCAPLRAHRRRSERHCCFQARLCHRTHASISKRATSPLQRNQKPLSAGRIKNRLCKTKQARQRRVQRDTNDRGRRRDGRSWTGTFDPTVAILQQAGMRDPCVECKPKKG
jgi:hypothetical protein